MKDSGVEIDYDDLIKKIAARKRFVPIPKYPPITEDLTITLKDKDRVGNVIEKIKNQSNLIRKIEVIDRYESNVTFHITYQSDKRNLTREDVEGVREKILKTLK